MPRPGEFDPASVAAFHHDGWDYDARSGTIRLRYRLDVMAFEEHFVLAPAAREGASGAAFERAVGVLHVGAGTSYYKAAAPPVVTGVPTWAEAFVRELYLDGLAEYAMTNGLDPIEPAIETVAGAAGAPFGADGPALVAVGGGKDSIVALESVRRSDRPFALASVNTHRAIEGAASVSGGVHHVVRRTLDPRLLELNAQGARNGHVPVTAINSAALAVLAVGLGAGAIVMANESSASVPITMHRGRPVNHQWSKSLAAERWLAGLLPVPYFSLVRPLHEVEIARRFARLPAYFGVVTSCNQAFTAVGRAAGTRWCGHCPKCRFVFLALAPFLSPLAVRHIFDGLDPLADVDAVEPYRAILGLGGEPPLECVGTTRESQWAMAHLVASDDWRHHVVVRALAPSLPDLGGWDPLSERGEHAIPPGWIEVADALA